MIKTNLCGIYCIRNIINQKRYIGQATDIRERWNRHLGMLNTNSHWNDHLQSSWNKYGEDSFEFTILELCSNEKLDDKEKWWIRFYQVQYREFVYNGKDGGQNGGSKYTDESRRKMSESHKKKN